MPGINSSGAPQTRDYTLGRGIVRLASLTAAGLPDADGFRDLGNAPEFGITVSAEDVRHQSSRTQLKFTDKRCTVSQEVGVTFILDEMNYDNLADYFSGDTEVFTNTHDTAWVGHEIAIVGAAIKMGNWYQLKSDAGDRIYDLQASGLVYSFEEDPATAAVLLAEGVDYELDHEMGLVRFLPASILVTDGDTVGWEIGTAASAGQDLDQVNALTQADVTGALLFIQTNACDQGNKSEYLFHKVSLSSDGDLPLIGDEIQTASFTGVAEVNSGVTDTSQVLTVRTYDQQA
jgi:hypothetical protein